MVSSAGILATTPVQFHLSEYSLRKGCRVSRVRGRFPSMSNAYQHFSTLTPFHTLPSVCSDTAVFGVFSFSLSSTTAPAFLVGFPPVFLLLDPAEALLSDKFILSICELSCASVPCGSLLCTALYIRRKRIAQLGTRLQEAVRRAGMHSRGRRCSCSSSTNTI